MTNPVVNSAETTAAVAASRVVAFVVAHPKSFFYGVVGETLVIVLGIVAKFYGVL